MASKAKKVVKAPIFRLSLGRVCGTKYTFTKSQYESLGEVLNKAKAAFGQAQVKEVIITVR